MSAVPEAARNLTSRQRRVLAALYRAGENGLERAGSVVSLDPKSFATRATWEPLAGARGLAIERDGRLRITRLGRAAHRALVESGARP